MFQRQFFSISNLIISFIINKIIVFTTHAAHLTQHTLLCIALFIKKKKGNIKRNKL